MGFIFGGGANVTTKADRITQFQTATCSFGQGLPIAYGTVKFNPQVINYQDFTSVEKRTTVKTGKHSHSTTIDYDYYCYLELGLAEGVIDGFGRVWLGDTVYNSLDALNASKVEGSPLSGNRGDNSSPSAYMQQKHSNIACRYDNLARVYGYIYLGHNTASVPSYSFELYGSLRSTGDGTDANVAAVIRDMLKRAGMDAYIDESSYQNYYNYCNAADWRISTPAGKMDSQASTQSYVEELLGITNTYMSWSNGKFKFIPRDDRTHGSWKPNKTIVYDLTHDDLSPYNDGVVTVKRKDATEKYNYIQVTFTNRANQYETETISYQNPEDIKINGTRKLEVDASWLHTKARAVKLAEMKARIAATERNQYTFQLGWKYAILEPGDLVRISDPSIGLSNQVVMIEEINEDANGLLTVTAIERAAGDYSSAQFEVVDEYQYIDLNIIPSNTRTPLFITPPADMVTSVSGVELWIAVRGLDEKYGGCDVYASNEDSGYRYCTRHNKNSNYGITRSELTADGDTVIVELYAPTNYSPIVGTNLTSAADRGDTLFWLDGEYISYLDCELVGVNTYKFSNLRRGEHSSPVSSHGNNAEFAMIDSDLCILYLEKEHLGETIYMKFPSFNVFGKNAQSVADVGYYTTVIQAYDIPNVRNITTQSRYLDYMGSGFYPRYDIIVSWTPPDWNKYDCSEVYYKCSGTGVGYASDGVTIEDPSIAGYAVGWQSAGVGYNTVTIPQAMAGQKYLIAVCVQDIHGFQETPDVSAQIEITVASKTAIPETPGNFQVIYSNPPVATWDHVTNADIVQYRLRSGYTSDDMKLIGLTNGNSYVLSTLTERSGRLWLTAESVFNKYSADAIVDYHFPELGQPSMPTLYNGLGVINIRMDTIPPNVPGIHLYINDELIVTGNNTYTYACESGMYTVKYCYYDFFGEGPKSTSATITVKDTIDQDLILDESITKAQLSKELQDVIDQMAEQKTYNEKLEALIKANEDNIVSLKADTKLNAAGIVNNANEITTTVATVKANTTSIAELKTTATQMSSSINDTVNGLAKHKSLIQQNADSITSVVENLNCDASVSTYSAIQQLDDAIGLCVKDTDFNGEEVVSRINMSPTTVAIEGKYIHITGDTVFDDDVEIKGHMTAGSIDCSQGLTINGGAATFSSSGLSVSTSNNEILSIDERGLTYTDSTGFSYAGIGRAAYGKINPADYEGKRTLHNIKFVHPFTKAPSVMIVPDNLNYLPVTPGESVFPRVISGVESVTKEGFTAYCYSKLGGGYSNYYSTVQDLTGKGQEADVYTQWGIALTSKEGETQFTAETNYWGNLTATAPKGAKKAKLRLLVERVCDGLFAGEVKLKSYLNTSNVTSEGYHLAYIPEHGTMADIFSYEVGFGDTPLERAKDLNVKVYLYSYIPMINSETGGDGYMPIPSSDINGRLTAFNRGFYDHIRVTLLSAEFIYYDTEEEADGTDALCCDCGFTWFAVENPIT